MVALELLPLINSFFYSNMSLRRAPSLSTLVSKGHRIAQLSRQVEALQRQLKDAEVEMDELMNAESQRLQILEKDKTQLFKDKQGAEIKAANLQYQYTHSQAQLKELQRMASEVIQDKGKAEVKAEMLLARVAELEAQLREKQEVVVSSGIEPHEESERIAGGDQIVQPEGANVQGVQNVRDASPMQGEVSVSELPKDSTSSTDLAGVCSQPSTLGDTTSIAKLESQEEQTTEASDSFPKVEVAPDQSTSMRMEDATAVPECKLIAYPEDALRSVNASSWFPAAFKYVNMDLSEQYLAFVRDYVAFEGAKHWSSSPKGLPAKDRPKELTCWIAGCCYERVGSEPKLKKEDVTRFSQAFMVWWTSLKSSSVEKVSGKGRNSGPLNIGGKNGWLSIKWWGMALDEDREGPAGDDWRRAIFDVHSTLKKLFNDAIVD
ncbi:hypothetical protein FB446DRAFT_795018 [Lentinula raphanica]|nr:hypothetical protein FB446DRAFT_795018 [Lentinula raphanica]